MSFVMWLLTQRADAPTSSVEPESARARQALSGSTYEEQRSSLSPQNNPISPTGICTPTDTDGDGLLDTPPLGIDYDFSRGPSIGPAPESQSQDCSIDALISRLDRKHPGFRIRWIKAGPLNLSRTSPDDRYKLLRAISEERTRCQSGSY